MLKRCYSLIFIVFLLAGCVHKSPKMPTPMLKPSVGSTKQIRQPGSFTEVNVKGRINVSLHTGYKQPQVILTGDPRDLAQVSTVVMHSALYLVVGEGAPKFGAINADIRGRLLDSFRYEGAGSITGNQLNTTYLDLYISNPGTTHLGGSVGLQNLEVVGPGQVQIDGVRSHNLTVRLKGNPKVQLTGFASLAKLYIDGDAWFSLYWIKSNYLWIRATNTAKIQLAGIVNRLDVELWGRAIFKGRYLRAQRSFVKTHNYSVAEISAVYHQSNLARDASDIYYFNIPTTRNDFMAFNGSVLDMREWNEWDMRDFNRFNKHFP